MKSVNISFNNARQEELSARLTFPLNQKPKAYALFAHCFTCDKNLNAIRNISQALNQEVFAVFSFDFTGLGKS